MLGAGRKVALITADPLPQEQHVPIPLPQVEVERRAADEKLKRELSQLQHKIAEQQAQEAELTYAERFFVLALFVSVNYPLVLTL